MSEATHTPGPWSVSDKDASGNASEHYLFIEPGIAVIERKVAGQDESDMSDALLIAAAPELLEALKRCRFDSLNMSLADLEFCRAAYAKATGTL